VVPPKKVVAVDAVSYAVMFAGGETFIVFNGEKVHVVSFPVQGIGDDGFVVIAGRRSMVGDGGLRGRRRHRRPGRMVATLSARLALDSNWRWRHSRRHGRTVEGRREMASTGPLAGLDLFSLLPKIGALQAAGRIFFGKVDRAEISALRDGGGVAGPSIPQGSGRSGSAAFGKPKVGDFVLVRDIALSKQHGRKLEARWSTPRVVDSISSSAVSAYVRELHHAPGKTKRYHVEDLLVYTPRQPDVSTAPIAPVVEYARGAMGVQEAFVPGQRAFHLSV
jgi:hypothetical protein